MHKDALEYMHYATVSLQRFAGAESKTTTDALACGSSPNGGDDDSIRRHSSRASTRLGGCYGQVVRDVDAPVGFRILDKPTSES